MKLPPYKVDIFDEASPYKIFEIKLYLMKLFPIKKNETQ